MFGSMVQVYEEFDLRATANKKDHTNQGIEWEERNRSPVLTFVCFVHELEELIDHRLQEFPVCFEESWILAHNIHDIGSNDRFVVFASLDFAKTEEILDDRDQEALLCLLVY